MSEFAEHSVLVDTLDERSRLRNSAQGAASGSVSIGSGLSSASHLVGRCDLFGVC